jgi:hypothetical protein
MRPTANFYPLFINTSLQRGVPPVLEFSLSSFLSSEVLLTKGDGAAGEASVKNNLSRAGERRGR